MIPLNISKNKSTHFADFIRKLPKNIRTELTIYIGYSITPNEFVGILNEIKEFPDNLSVTFIFPISRQSDKDHGLHKKKVYLF